MAMRTTLTQIPPPPVPEALPVLPLRGGTVVYPMAVLPMRIGQPRSVKLVDDVMKGERMVALVAERPEADIDNPAPADLFDVGTAGLIQQMLRDHDGTLRLLVQGLERIKVGEFRQTEPYMVARVQEYPEQAEDGLETEAMSRAVVELFAQLSTVVTDIAPEVVPAARTLTDSMQLVYLVASAAPLTTEVRQELLELDPVDAKLRRLIESLQHELAVRELGQKITDETRERMSKAQREYYLREQLRAIQRELGEEAGTDDVSDLRSRLLDAPMPEEARHEAERELARLNSIPSASPEHGIIRTYLECLADLPWRKFSGSEIDVTKARLVLDEDHYDLDKVKDRIVEHLAVQKLRAERGAANPADEAGRDPAREPILCFIGPPGVGKTSLGQSIARALGRKFARISLGGVHDEAEIRGHRRTYIGAMPGRIVQAIRRAGTADPVFMLDEIDKVGSDWRGDPASALLEVLDPAQNSTFVDSYLGVPFDLSHVLFIATANTLDTIPGPLLDRMEVLQLSGYTDQEKVAIAQAYLVPKQLARARARHRRAALRRRGHPLDRARLHARGRRPQPRPRNSDRQPQGGAGDC